MTKTMTMTDLWEELNPRQQAYLKAVYAVDQAAERNERGAWNRGERARPAEQWRWLAYGHENGYPSALLTRLRDQNQVDQGTGSTFEALEQRGLITCRYDHIPDPMLGVETLLRVKMTPLGRKVVRAATDEKRAPHLPPGTLREWHWKALVLTYQAHLAGQTGVDKERGGYGRMNWNTWLRLRDYGQHHEAALAEEYLASGAPGAGADYVMRITRFGLEYYEREYARYRALYPGVKAPAPAGLTTDAPLQRWHWEALAKLVQADPAGGLAQDAIGDRAYGGIAVNVWERLFKFPGEKLARRVHRSDRIFQDWWVQLTPAGLDYYRREWARYHALYSDVDAPQPEVPANEGTGKL